MRHQTKTRALSIRLLTAAAALCCASCSITVQNTGSLEVPREAVVESSAVLDVTEFNAYVDDAAAAGERWVSNPIMVVMEYLRHPDAPVTKITRTDPPGESMPRTTVTVLQDRFLDDSVRGTWHEFSLDRLPDGSWRIDEARSGYRCYRGRQTDSYGAHLCP
jgi:hypothetical protein